VVARGAGTRTARLVALAAFAAVVALAPATARPAESPTDRDVKAAFLYHFTQYVEWPAAAFESPESPVILGVLGDVAYLQLITASAGGKSVGGRPIVVREIRSPSGAVGCHVVFVGASQAAAVPAIVRAVGASPVLTVSDAPEFAKAGGAVGFVVKNGKVAFQVNVKAAGRAGLKVSSKLLRLAEIVEEERRA